MAERRGARRVDYLCDVECEGPAPDPLQPHMRDLSASGAFVTGERLPAVGARLWLSFAVPAGALRVSAEVVRVHEGGMGVRFLDLDERQQAAILRAVQGAPASKPD